MTFFDGLADYGKRYVQLAVSHASLVIEGAFSNMFSSLQEEKRPL